MTGTGQNRGRANGRLAFETVPAVIYETFGMAEMLSYILIAVAGIRPVYRSPAKHEVL